MKALVVVSVALFVLFVRGVAAPHADPAPTHE